MEAAGFRRDEMPPLDEIPRFDKSLVRADEAAHPPFGTHRVVGLEQARRVGSSTGTTGTPTIIFYGERDFEVSGEVNVRNMWRHGVRAGDRFTHSWPQGIYPTNVTASRSYLTVGALEIAVGPPFTTDIAAEHLRLWQLLRPTAFMLTSGQLLTYEDAAAAAGIDLAELTDGAILVLLEASCQFEGPRRRVEQAYGVQLRNTGGASEVPGLATTDCTFHTGLHVAGDHFVVQACDPVTGREVADGERGTSSCRRSASTPTSCATTCRTSSRSSRGRCECGETGPRYTLLGRGADAVHVAGRTLLPLDVQLVLEEVGSPEFQLVADPDGRTLRMRVECDGDRRADHGGRRRGPRRRGRRRGHPGGQPAPVELQAPPHRRIARRDGATGGMLDRMELGIHFADYTLPGEPATIARHPRCGGEGGRGHGLRAVHGDGPLVPDGAASAPPRIRCSRATRRSASSPAQTRAHRARSARHRRDVPTSRPAGQDRHHPRRAVGWAGRARHRGGVVRARAPRSRRAVPAGGGALRAPRGDAADLPADVERRRRTVRRDATTSWPRRCAGRSRSAGPTRRSSSAGVASARRCDSSPSTATRATCSRAASTRSHTSSTCSPGIATTSGATAPRSRSRSSPRSAPSATSTPSWPTWRATPVSA